MLVYIVIKNGQVDEVFFSAEAAELHRKNLQKRWNITKTVIREVKEL